MLPRDQGPHVTKRFRIAPLHLRGQSTLRSPPESRPPSRPLPWAPSTLRAPAPPPSRPLHRHPQGPSTLKVPPPLGLHPLTPSGPVQPSLGPPPHPPVPSGPLHPWAPSTLGIPPPLGPRLHPQGLHLHLGSWAMPQDNVVTAVGWRLPPLTLGPPPPLGPLHPCLPLDPLGVGGSTLRAPSILGPPPPSGPGPHPCVFRFPSSPTYLPGLTPRAPHVNERSSWYGPGSPAQPFPGLSAKSMPLKGDEL